MAAVLADLDALQAEGAALAVELEAALRAATAELDEARGPLSPEAFERCLPLSALDFSGVGPEVAKGGDGDLRGVPWRYVAGLRRRGERLHREAEELRECAAALRREFGQSREGVRAGAEWAQRSADYVRAVREWGEEVGAYWRDRRRLRGDVVVGRGVGGGGRADSSG